MGAVSGVPHSTVRRVSSNGSVGSYNQVPLSVIETATDEAAQSSQDTPMDFSVTSRSTLTTETAVKHSIDTELKGSTVF